MLNLGRHRSVKNPGVLGLWEDFWPWVGGSLLGPPCSGTLCLTYRILLDTHDRSHVAHVAALSRPSDTGRAHARSDDRCGDYSELREVGGAGGVAVCNSVSRCAPSRPRAEHDAHARARYDATRAQRGAVLSCMEVFVYKISVVCLRSLSAACPVFLARARCAHDAARSNSTSPTL